jgi:hypothetical protein
MLRSLLLISCATLALAACGSKTFPSICTVQPAPTACSQKCTPGGADTCPNGFYCDSNGNCDAQCTQMGSQCGSGYQCAPDGQCQSTTDCTDLSCKVAQCESMGKPATTISGQVFAPNGTLPLYGIYVYVPDTNPGPMATGLQCNRCSDGLPGSPVGNAVQTDVDGKFSVSGVPSGSNIPLVITSGKWRRIINIPTVNSCTDNPVAAADTTLPKSRTDLSPNTAKTNGISMPKIAISTGGADALECLVRKLGIADTEITTDAGSGYINLFSDTQSSGSGTSSFQTGFGGGTGKFTDSQMLWGSESKLQGYDIVINSCEGGQYPNTKSQAEMNNLKMYADLGGRVFLSHWHNIWIEGSTQGGGNQAPPVWTSIATWNNSQTTFTTPPDTIDEVNNPKGPAFAQWMLNVGGSPSQDVIPIDNNTGKNTCTSVDNTKAERWVYWTGGGAGSAGVPQNFQFTTPNEDAPSARCGKVAFSDMHVSGDSTSDPAKPYPSGCSTAGLTPQEKALAFMFFDIASCVSTIIQ